MAQAQAQARSQRVVARAQGCAIGGTLTDSQSCAMWSVLYASSVVVCVVFFLIVSHNFPTDENGSRPFVLMGVHTGVSPAYYRSLPSGYTRPGVFDVNVALCTTSAAWRLAWSPGWGVDVGRAPNRNGIESQNPSTTRYAE